jgi:hypothetical protein
LFNNLILNEARKYGDKFKENISVLDFNSNINEIYKRDEHMDLNDLNDLNDDINDSSEIYNRDTGFNKWKD